MVLLLLCRIPVYTRYQVSQVVYSILVPLRSINSIEIYLAQVLFEIYLVQVLFEIRQGYAARILPDTARGVQVDNDIIQHDTSRSAPVRALPDSAPIRPTLLRIHMIYEVYSKAKAATASSSGALSGADVHHNTAVTEQSAFTVPEHNIILHTRGASRRRSDARLRLRACPYWRREVWYNNR